MNPTLRERILPLAERLMFIASAVLLPLASAEPLQRAEGCPSGPWHSRDGGVGAMSSTFDARETVRYRIAIDCQASSKKLSLPSGYPYPAPEKPGWQDLRPIDGHANLIQDSPQQALSDFGTVARVGARTE